MLSRAEAIASLPIPVEFNSLLHITTSTAFNVAVDLLAGCSGWRGELLTGCVGNGGDELLAGGRERMFVAQSWLSRRKHKHW